MITEGEAEREVGPDMACEDKTKGEGIRQRQHRRVARMLLWKAAVPVTCRMTLVKLPNFFEPQFPHVQNGIIRVLPIVSFGEEF